MQLFLNYQNFPKGISYATEEFKKVVDENNIKGFNFKEL